MKNADMEEVLRPLFAGLAMHAILGRVNIPRGAENPEVEVARMAVASADALLAELQKPRKAQQPSE